MAKRKKEELLLHSFLDTRLDSSSVVRQIMWLLL